MEEDASCSLHYLLRRIFRKKDLRSETRTAVTPPSGSSTTTTETRNKTVNIIRIRGAQLPRRKMPPHLRHLTRENSLAPYLGRKGELLVMHRTRVSVVPADNLRDMLRQEQRVNYSDSSTFDSFTEASASCPIAEESFDSGLLKMTTPWFMEYSE